MTLDDMILNFHKKYKGFTIIELLVIISIVGLLSTFAIFSINKSRNDANTVRIKADLKTIVTMIDVARDKNNTVLLTVTGSGCSECACRNRGDLSLLPSSDSCIVSMTNFFKKIGFENIIRDPWGVPYLMDENELEGGFCNRDSLKSAGPNKSTGTGDMDNIASQPINFFVCR